MYEKNILIWNISGELVRVNLNYTLLKTRVAFAQGWQRTILFYTKHKNRIYFLIKIELSWNWTRTELDTELDFELILTGTNSLEAV